MKRWLVLSLVGAANLLFASPVVASTTPASSTQFAQAIASDPLASTVGHSMMQALFAAAPSQPPLPLTASEVARLHATDQAHLTVRDALQLAQMVRDSTSPVTVNVSSPPNASKSTPYPAAPAAAARVATVKHHHAKRTTRVLAHIASGYCFGGVQNVNQFALPTIGTDTFYIGAGFTGVCDTNNNQYIASVGGWRFPSGANFPGVCVTDNATYHGGEGNFNSAGNSTWIHGLQTMSVGIGISGLCEGIRSVSSAIRADVNAYWDCYNDFGFGGNYGCDEITHLSGPY